jgi:hypothetical protein
MSRFFITEAHRDDGKRFVVHADETFSVGAMRVSSALS